MKTRVFPVKMWVFSLLAAILVLPLLANGCQRLPKKRHAAVTTLSTRCFFQGGQRLRLHFGHQVTVGVQGQLYC